MISATNSGMILRDTKTRSVSDDETSGALDPTLQFGTPPPSPPPSFPFETRKGRQKEDDVIKA